jgi:hypothetical protein
MPQGDSLTIYCGTDDLEKLSSIADLWRGSRGNRWRDKNTGVVFEGTTLTYCGPGNPVAHAIFPQNDPEAQGRDAHQAIVLCPAALRPVPELQGQIGSIPWTTRSQMDAGLIRHDMHVEQIYRRTISSRLLHEFFHCAYHDTSEQAMAISDVLPCSRFCSAWWAQPGALHLGRVRGRLTARSENG